MSELTFHDGVPVASSKGIRLVIEDMRRVLEMPGFALNMHEFESMEKDGICLVCAGTAAIMGGMGYSPEKRPHSTTREQDAVASLISSIMFGEWDFYGADVVPQVARDVWSPAMQEASGPNFFPAWERFADAWEADEKEAASA